jgi:NADPH:quinone reductase-like Zn-dependent oxidoreductase
VIATTALATSDPWLREMGAHHVIDERASLDNELRRIGIPEVEYVASLSCSEKWLAMFPQILKPHGHLALVDDPKSFDVVSLKQKSVTISMESRSMTAGFEHAIRRRHAILQEVADLVDAGVLRTIMTRQEAPICADTLRRCYAISESGRSVGKVVLSGFV